MVKWIFKCLAIIFCVFYISLGLVFNKFTLEIFIPSSYPTITNYLNPRKIDDEKLIKVFSGLAFPISFSFYMLSICTIIGILNEKRIGLLRHIAALASLTVSVKLFCQMSLIILTITLGAPPP